MKPKLNLNLIIDRLLVCVMFLFGFFGFFFIWLLIPDYFFVVQWSLPSLSLSSLRFVQPIRDLIQYNIRNNSITKHKDFITIIITIVCFWREGKNIRNIKTKQKFLPIRLSIFIKTISPRLIFQHAQPI